ncbi:Legumain [Blattella germanica]|nr:Legumain [Blattella germanica]
MMYDDIANTYDNPRKGVLINRPNGPNVYKGVLKDYTERTVNVKNFLKILTGDAEGMKGIGSGRVINSGPNDHVFVNFVDHGGDYVLCFPHNEELYAPDLIATFKKMAANKRFAKLVMYVEACEAGSMFDKLLPEDLNGMYPINEKTDEETLQYQYQVVENDTLNSHVSEYGDLTTESMRVSDFMGVSERNNSISASNSWLPPMDDAVSSRDVPIAILEHKFEAEVDPKKKQEYLYQLHKIRKYRRHLEKVVEEILFLGSGKNEELVDQLQHHTYSLKLDDFDCYKKLVSTFTQSCFSISENPYVLSQLRFFANVCGHPEVSEYSVVAAIKKVCSSQHLLIGVE